MRLSIIISLLKLLYLYLDCGKIDCLLLFLFNYALVIWKFFLPSDFVN